MALQELKVPDIGDFKEVEVIEVLVKAGDTITAEQSLITVESDKASMEIPASFGGVIKELKIKVGDKVSEGTLLAMVEAAAAAAPAPSSAPSPTPVAAAPAQVTSTQVTPTQATPAASGPVQVMVPDIGDFKDVEVIEVLVKVGDTVAAEQSLVTVESDKASMEIPSSAAGVVAQLVVKVGDKINKGDLLAVLQGAAATAPTAVAAAPASQASAPAPVAAAPASVAPVSTPAAPIDHAAQIKAHASPSVRKFARELGVNLSLVRGSGPKERITADDVQAFVKQAVSVATGGGAHQPKAGVTSGAGGTGSGFGANFPAWPSLDFSKFGPTKTEPLSRIKKISGPNLARNWAAIPHVTQFDQADVTDLEQFRKDSNAALEKSGAKVTMLAFVMKACVSALQKFPAFNSSLDANGENLILKQYYNIGFAADTPNGLVVPVIKDCDKKSIVQIAKETAELAAKARDGKLGLPDMQGATFTISSLGGVGGTQFTPIINAPEVAILGLSKTEFKPVWDGKQFVPRLMLPLSLSYDHRVIDGAMGARFTTYLADVLADMRKVLL